MSAPFSSSVRATHGATQTRVLSGYASVFYDPANKSATQYQLAPGCVERIQRTAFDRSLKDNADVVCLYQHDGQFLIGRTSSGTCRLKVDSVGLFYECDIPKNPNPPNLIDLLDRGDLVSSSFCFVPTSVAWTDEGDLSIRWIKDCLLLDCSVVNSPAYSGATASVRTANATMYRPQNRLTLDQQSKADAVAERLRQLDHADAVDADIARLDREEKADAVNAVLRRINSR